ncbi:energy transducer TonB [uncultured Kushneria sp.]|uniref:energy transducer TonB n=1 Tax=uncultured Kushneria sp. TaxID=905033 RepID=UPI00260E0B54|nr:energy transducer TonB [uncultured Kushneria sp.]
MRQALALLGALALALLLFWGLALMVAPPEPRDTPQETMTMSIVDNVAAPARAPEASNDIAAAAPPPPPPAAPARPAPAPLPAEDVQSDIQLQEQEVSEPQAPDVRMNDDLPELEVEKPEPRPEPKPEPKPEPRPAPTPPKQQATPTPSSQGTQQSEQQGSQSGGTPEGATAQGGGTVQAQPTSRVQPEYPMRARRRGEEGFVEMSFIINADGSVDAGSIQVTASEPGGVFDSAARDAIEQWQFPSRDAPARTRQRLVFKLR